MKSGESVKAFHAANGLSVGVTVRVFYGAADTGDTSAVVGEVRVVDFVYGCLTDPFLSLPDAADGFDAGDSGLEGAAGDPESRRHLAAALILYNTRTASGTPGGHPESKRLPTELEWEAAAAGADPARSNLDGRAFGCAPAGAYADGAADCGAVQMLGEVWEWTSSELEGYPGFRAFPYPEYSQVFFGPEHKVLRGGSWASAGRVAFPTFRNWDLPARRQIFAGVRIAQDGA